MLEDSEKGNGYVSGCMTCQKCLRDVGSERSVGDVSVKASTEHCSRVLREELVTLLFQGAMSNARSISV